MRQLKHYEKLEFTKTHRHKPLCTRCHLQLSLHCEGAELTTQVQNYPACREPAPLGALKVRGSYAPHGLQPPV